MNTLTVLLLLPILCTAVHGLGDVSTETLLEEVYRRMAVEGEVAGIGIVGAEARGAVLDGGVAVRGEGRQVLGGRAGAVRGRSVGEGTVEDECKKLLEKFSESSSSFIRCATRYAKPIFMCRKCETDFLNVRTFYFALEHSESEGINCKDLLTSRDKVEIIKATYSYIVGPEGLWTKAHCDSCYTRPLNRTSRLTQITTEFFALARTVQDCFDSHPNVSLETNRSEACTQCQVDYRALNTFYREQVFSSFPFLEGICFDILDTMNMTQRYWGSDHYHCGKRLVGSVPLIIAVVCVLLTPVAFYVTARYYKEPRGERTVVHSGHITDLLTQAQREHDNSRVLEDEITEVGDGSSTASSASHP